MCEGQCKGVWWKTPLYSTLYPHTIPAHKDCFSLHILSVFNYILHATIAMTARCFLIMRLPCSLIALFVFFSSHSFAQDAREIYDNCGLKDKLNFGIFETAYNGIGKYDPAVKDKITIFDVTSLSTKKRFYVIDLKNKKLLYHTLCAHGKGSGENKAETFSNDPGSLATAPGFYLTLGTYSGKHGYSLKLKGLEKGVNDNAESRSIVIHGADYVSTEFVKKQGRIGRSWGCPALPVDVSKEIIDCIKDGTLLYIYSGK